MESRTALIVLAAGNSSRMGRPKQLLTYAGSTLIEHTLQLLKPIPSSKIFVVTGAFHEEVSLKMASFGAELVHNAQWQLGMGSSLAKGVQEVMKDPSFNQVMITLCDLPLLYSSFYKSIIEFHESNKNDITRTAYSDVKGVPAVFDRRFFSELTTLSSEEGAKKVLQNHKKRVTDFHWPEPYFDVDTPEAYAKLLELSGE